MGNCTFSEVRPGSEKWPFSAVLEAQYASPYRKFESHPPRHTVKILRELDFPAKTFGLKCPLFALFRDPGEHRLATESPWNGCLSLHGEFEVRSAFTLPCSDALQCPASTGAPHNGAAPRRLCAPPTKALG
jgi:hypothetical protein